MPTMASVTAPQPGSVATWVASSTSDIDFVFDKHNRVRDFAHGADDFVVSLVPY